MSLKTSETLNISDLEGIQAVNICFLESNGSGPNFLALSKDKNEQENSINMPDLKGKWRFGFLNYDLKNEFEELYSENLELFDLPKVYFFEPDLLLKISNGDIDSIISDRSFLDSIPYDVNYPINIPNLIQRTSKEEYLANFDQIQFHIKRGDIYEINYCIEWYSENAQINPYLVYEKLNELTQAPFSAFFKLDDQFVLCGSPERFIRKYQNTILSQPIKGTIKRGLNDENDELKKRMLKLNVKERAENVMTTDVVRNDFSKISQKASVSVKELAELHTFKTVHHLVSAIEAQVRNEVEFEDMIKATFPMASMTGAPKISAMKISEKLEDFKRGIYSGSIGYIDNLGDFDFNVVIRSIIYNHKTGHLSIPVGGAITSKSDPLQEYEECLLKAEAMFEALK